MSDNGLTPSQILKIYLNTVRVTVCSLLETNDVSITEHPDGPEDDGTYHYLFSVTAKRPGFNDMQVAFNIPENMVEKDYGDFLWTILAKFYQAYWDGTIPLTPPEADFEEESRDWKPGDDEEDEDDDNNTSRGDVL